MLMVNASAFAVSILLNVEFGCYWLMVNASVVFLVCPCKQANVCLKSLLVLVCCLCV